MPRNNIEKNSPSQVLASLPRPQKIAVWSLAFLAVLIVFFWTWQFQANIKRPFKIKADQSASSALLDPREQDTDGDGLSDYDEINIFQTSPYLEDTDSDNVSDKQEIDQGSDPNCPVGRNCNAIDTDKTNAPTSTPLISPVFNLDSSGAPETILQNALSGQLDAVALRQLLISAGSDPTALEQISDADLMSIYQESLNNQSTSTP